MKLRIDDDNARHFPYGHFLYLIGSKWKPYLLIAIKKEGTIRFNEAQRLTQASSKALSQAFRELEQDGLIYKIASDDPKMLRSDYYLTEDGENIIPVLYEIYKYGLKDMKKKGLFIDPRTYNYTKHKKEK